MELQDATAANTSLIVGSVDGTGTFTLSSPPPPGMVEGIVAGRLSSGESIEESCSVADTACNASDSWLCSPEKEGCLGANLSNLAAASAVR